MLRLFVFCYVMFCHFCHVMLCMYVRMYAYDQETWSQVFKG
jgi:hypothetical protein